MRYSLQRNKVLQILSIVLLAAFAVLQAGCGASTSYDQPAQVLTSTPNALIEPDTLKSWMDQGLVNGDGLERVVILTVTTSVLYNPSHIPGALLWDSGSELHMTRVEALAQTPTMVLDGLSMDKILQRSGIDRGTTIVLSHSGANANMMNTSRAYFTLRYWGIPRERIKMLNGGDAAWSAAITANGWNPARYWLTPAVPVITRSSFGVRDNGVLRSDLRLALGEMLQEVDRNIVDNSTLGNILDARGMSSGIDDFNTTTLRTGYSFEGRLSNAIRDDHTQYYAGTGFKTRTDLETYLLTTLSVDPGKKFIAYCVSGMRASTVFAVLDGIFGWDVAMYDGSWQQWAKYGDRTSSAPNDAWRTDLNSRSVITSLTTGNSDLVIDLESNALYTTNTDPRANQIENADEDYMKGVGLPKQGGGGGPASGC